MLKGHLARVVYDRVYSCIRREIKSWEKTVAQGKPDGRSHVAIPHSDTHIVLPHTVLPPIVLPTMGGHFLMGEGQTGRTERTESGLTG